MQAKDAIDDGWRWVMCEECNGYGTIEFIHPLWGLRSCPEPTIERVCDGCSGCGRQLVETFPVTEEDMEAYAETEQPREH